MEYALAAVAAIVTIVLVARFAPKLGVAAPLILIVVGSLFSFLPFAPSVEVDPEWILVGVLPPLLYSAAVNVPLMDFRRNLKAITGLSVVLVILSTAVSGYLLYLIFPDLDLAAAFALGAVISPPDAVAATAIGKRLGLPGRLVTVLEGEGLVNDATALVLLRSAIAATAGVVSLWGFVGDFVFAVAVAIGVGIAIGFATVAVRARLNNPVLNTSISFAVPFIAYLPAEELGASGVLSVVVAGLVAGHRSATRLTAQDRISERLNWRTVQFILENGVFLLMGTEVATLVVQVEDDDLGVGSAVLIGLLMTAVLIVVRFAFMVPLIASLRRDARRAQTRGVYLDQALDRLRGAPTDDPRVRARASRISRMLARRRADVDSLTAEGLGWRGGVVLGWSGMRGVVTLAAAQSLPRDLPYRPQLILVAFTVALVTLLLQGGTLPALIGRLRVTGASAERERDDLASLLEEISTTGLATVSDTALEGEEPVEPTILTRVRAESVLRAAAVRETGGDGGAHAVYVRLRRRVLEAERAALIEARSLGVHRSTSLAKAEHLLDQEEARLYRHDGGH
ncbi:sodium:proton antiporter [Occultella glacieicola]|uniref:Sodium:proton antiporter n=1 Tax=Occultella glacieicola TaxID=2518684 RepID=A0ABY2E1A5_9MICO|nr:sodium:proton antiporter [Occultella glacieicola]TDE91705.1 sodium:proton antiporter [Occultella glacieicola]